MISYKLLFFSILLGLFSIQEEALGESPKEQKHHLSIHIAPLLSFIRTYNTRTPALEIKGATPSFHFGMGYLYSFYTHGGIYSGLNMSRIPFRWIRKEKGSVHPSLDQSYLLWKVSIPLLLYLETNEWAIDTKWYVKTGLLSHLLLPLIHTKTTNGPPASFMITAKDRHYISTSFGFGTGIVRQITFANSLQIGLFYLIDIRGFLKKNDLISGDIRAYSDELHLECQLNF